MFDRSVRLAADCHGCEHVVQAEVVAVSLTVINIAISGCALQDHGGTGNLVGMLELACNDESGPELHLVPIAKVKRYHVRGLEHFLPSA